MLFLAWVRIGWVLAGTLVKAWASIISRSVWEWFCEWDKNESVGWKVSGTDGIKYCNTLKINIFIWMAMIIYKTKRLLIVIHIQMFSIKCCNSLNWNSLGLLTICLPLNRIFIFDCSTFPLQLSRFPYPERANLSENVFIFLATSTFWAPRNRIKPSLCLEFTNFIIPLHQQS